MSPKELSSCLGVCVFEQNLARDRWPPTGKETDYEMRHILLNLEMGKAGERLRLRKMKVGNVPIFLLVMSYESFTCYLYLESSGFPPMIAVPCMEPCLVRRGLGSFANWSLSCVSLDAFLHGILSYSVLCRV